MGAATPFSTHGATPSMSIVETLVLVFVDIKLLGTIWAGSVEYPESHQAFANCKIRNESLIRFTSKHLACVARQLY